MKKSKEPNPSGGIFCLNKPRFFSSHDVVEIARRYLPVKKVGHAGTLDPLAEGLLILLAGQCTKKTEEFMGLDKEYRGTFLLGATTASYDADSEVEEIRKNFQLKKKDIQKALRQFEGEIFQTPPIFSAVHFQGQRAYQLARSGAVPELAARPVQVSRIKIESFKKFKDFYLLRLRIKCGKGFYVRSLARDLGEVLGCGAFLRQLVRTRIGPYNLKKALTLKKFIALAEKNSLVPVAAEKVMGNESSGGKYIK